MAMLNPCRPGETLRDDLEAAGVTVTETAGRLGCTRQALSRLLNGKAGISPAMAIALERRGWTTGCAFRPPTTWRRSGGGRRPERVTAEDLRSELAGRSGGALSTCRASRTPCPGPPFDELLAAKRLVA